MGVIDWVACVADGVTFQTNSQTQTIQEFQPPLKGFYRFSFSAHTSNNEPISETKVEVKLDGETKFLITDGSKERMNNISATWIWKMKVTSKVKFEVTSNELVNTNDAKVTFTGQLIYLLPPDDDDSQ